MHKFTLLIFLFLLFSHARSDAKEFGFYDALMLSQKQWYENTDVVSSWNKSFILFSNANKMDEKDECYKKSIGEVLLVLEIDEVGLVTKVFYSHDNEKSRCLSLIYEGSKLPRPPINPMYKLIRVL